MPRINDIGEIATLGCPPVFHQSASLPRWPGSDSCNPQFDLILQAFVILGQRLTALEKNVAEIQHHLRQSQVETKVQEIQDLLVQKQSNKEAYSPVEVAEILGKKAYTVREWCRLMRINARKRPYGRGGADEWEISHEELERIKAHGLLPIPTKY